MARSFETLEFKINGVQTNVKVAGEGPAILYLHGGSTLEGFDFALDLAERFRVYCPSHPGMGRSGDAPHIAGMRDMVIHYLNLIDELKLPQKPHLIGFSMGGWMAAEIAAVARESFDKVVFIAPDGLSDATCQSPDWSVIDPDDLPCYLSHDKSVAGQYFPKDPIAAQAFNANRVREDDIVGRLYGAAVGGPSNFQFLLYRITNPTLVVWGQQDRMVPFSQSSLWIQNLPNAILISVPDAGHLVLQEKPSVVGNLIEFLA